MIAEVEKVRDAVIELTMRADLECGVAGVLHASGMAGIPGVALSCPVSTWITDATQGVAAWVNTQRVSVHIDGWFHIVCATPPSIVDFINAFDAHWDQEPCLLDGPVARMPNGVWTSRRVRRAAQSLAPGLPWHTITGQVVRSCSTTLEAQCGCPALSPHTPDVLFRAIDRLKLTHKG